MSFSAVSRCVCAEFESPSHAQPVKRSLLKFESEQRIMSGNKAGLRRKAWITALR